MANLLVGYIEKDTLLNMGINMGINKYNQLYKDLTVPINTIIVKLRERCPDIAIHIKVNCMGPHNGNAFADKDCAVVYYNNNTGVYNLGKWNLNTLTNHESYNYNLRCGTAFQLAEYLNNHIRHNKSYKDENRLQEPEANAGEGTGREGVAIEIARGECTIESGQNCHGTSIVC